MELKKASELAKSLAKRFPHLEFVACNDRWDNCYQKHPAMFTSADLVISTIGGWSAESHLNALAWGTQEFPPLLFGWLEEHAAAGHAVAFFGENGCLRCLANEKGYSREPVTAWPAGGTQLAVPMCGGMFQPYGATELAFVQGLVADLAADVLLGRAGKSTHRVWGGQRKLLEQGRGVWNPDWVTKYGDPGEGGRLMDIGIVRDVACPVCGGRQ